MEIRDIRAAIDPLEEFGACLVPAGEVETALEAADIALGREQSVQGRGQEPRIDDHRPLRPIGAVLRREAPELLQGGRTEGQEQPGVRGDVEVDGLLIGAELVLQLAGSEQAHGQLTVGPPAPVKASCPEACQVLSHKTGEASHGGEENAVSDALALVVVIGHQRGAEHEGQEVQAPLFRIAKGFAGLIGVGGGIWDGEGAEDVLRNRGLAAAQDGADGLLRQGDAAAEGRKVHTILPPWQYLSGNFRSP